MSGRQSLCIRGDTRGRTFALWFCRPGGEGIVPVADNGVGVGPNTARMILSSFSTADLQGVIASGNVNLLKAVKGIGAKTAQRIIVDLRDKINQGADTLIIQSEATSETYEEAQAALIMLGFAKPAVQKALGKLLKDNPAEKVEGLIKKALKIL